MSALSVVVARNEDQIADAQRVRGRVYAEEERLLPASMLVDGREIDELDARPETTHLVAYRNGVAFGTVRLIGSTPSGQRSQGELASRFAVSALPDTALLAEVTRYCVIRAARGTAVTAGLFVALFQESLRQRITHWVAAANMETDSAEDAAIAYRVAAGMQLVTPATAVHSAVPGPHAASRVIYAAAERERAGRGDLRGLELPRTLSLFARRMGARFIGLPTYDAYFGVFALPLLVSLEELSKGRGLPRSVSSCRRAIDSGGAMTRGQRPRIQ